MISRVPATLPPAGLPGLDPAWSRLVDADDAEGVRRTWHLLDSGVAPSDRAGAALDGASAAAGTLLCVHGNPTWSYLWRHLLAACPPGWRVVAVDQLGMGWSERPDAPRTLAQRIGDLGGLTDALGLSGPVVTVAHDWGGPISLGWALAHREQLAGVVLTNTAVHHPPGSPAPALIRLARALRPLICERTPAFVRAATALSRPPLPAALRDAFAAPYGSAALRRAVGEFVADIPLRPSHPSAATLAAIADGLDALADVPVLLLWGPRDPVFVERYLRDLLARLPHAHVHRYEGASHLVTEDRPEAAAAISAFVSTAFTTAPPPPAPTGRRASTRTLGDALTERAGDPAPAVVELSRGAVRRTVTFATLERRVRELAAGLTATGVRPGDRVALLVPPGADLTAAVYACWRAGAIIVVADAGLGLRNMGRALRGAGPDHVIGTAKGLAAARAMRVPGKRIAAGPVDAMTRRALGAEHGLADLARLGGAAADRTPAGDPEAECAVVFTSGATGPPKGVVYRQRQVLASLGALRAAYDIGPQDRFVAAFAPFALYGPALGITSAVPDMDVTAPGTLTADALADAVQAIDATMVFASPAALRNVVATGCELTEPQRRALARPRLLLSAGAPVPVPLLREVSRLLPAASAHTPYGMTEVLPVADISLEELEKAGIGEGVCVGRPLAGVEVALDAESGEISVRAGHVKERYDRLWATERASSRVPGWHRTGDVGHLDADGRLWIEGRLVHVISTETGPVTPVGPERRIETLAAVRAAALVGVGPAGAQQAVAVVVPELAPGRGRLAGPELTAVVRAAAGVPLAAVLLAARLPVDIRHASKVDRALVARWASAVLAGERVRAL